MSNRLVVIPYNSKLSVLIVSWSYNPQVRIIVIICNLKQCNWLQIIAVRLEYLKQYDCK